MANVNGHFVCDLTGSKCVDMIRVKTKDGQIIDVNQEISASLGIDKPDESGVYGSSKTLKELVANIA